MTLIRFVEINISMTLLFQACAKLSCFCVELFSVEVWNWFQFIFISSPCLMIDRVSEKHLWLIALHRKVLVHPFCNLFLWFLSFVIYHVSTFLLSTYFNYVVPIKRFDSCRSWQFLHVLIYWNNFCLGRKAGCGRVGEMINKDIGEGTHLSSSSNAWRE